MEATLSIILAIVFVGWQGVESLPNGAPSSACDNLTPNSVSHRNTQPQTSAVPYNIDLSPLNDPQSSGLVYTPGQTYTRKNVMDVNYTT